MSAAQHAVMTYLEREPDPLLEEIVRAEGYSVAYATSLDELLERAAKGAFGVAAVVVGPNGCLREETIRELLERASSAKFLFCLPDGMALAVDAASRWPGRVLWVQGEVGSSTNAQRIRKFLCGDGYHWASDLAHLWKEDFVLDAADHLSDQQHDEVKSVLRFASDLSGFTDLRPMLEEALQKYLDIVQCGAGSLYLWDERTETLVLEAACGPDQDRRIGLRQKLGEGLAGWVAEVGEPILVVDSRKVHRLRGRTCRRYSNFSCVAVPISQNGKLYGVVCLTMPKNNRPLTPKDLRLAYTLSKKLGPLIRPLNVLSELRRFSENLMGAFRTSADMVLERDTEVAELRDLRSKILDSIPLGVIAYDRDLRIRSTNGAARELLGTMTPPHGKAPMEDGLQTEADTWRRKLSDVVEKAHEFRLSRVAYHFGNGKRMLDIHCSPLRDTSGRSIGGIITAQDVTEDVEMEEKLRRAERLALVGKIVAKVAHDLNNPLDGMLRFINLALRQIDKPEQARVYLEESRQGLQRMYGIISQLLAFSRGHYASDRPVSVSRLIRRALASYEQRAHQANIEINLDVPPDLPPCPSSEIWEVFENVVKNALDAMQEGGVLTVRAVRKDKRVTITVSDTGPGVPAELSEKIFDAFFTTKPPGAGTGLGLAVCRDALRQIGGDIRLLPVERGACFEILIPVQKDAE